MGPVFCYALSIAPLRCGLNLCKKGPRTVIARGLFLLRLTLSQEGRSQYKTVVLNLESTSQDHAAICTDNPIGMEIGRAHV